MSNFEGVVKKNANSFRPQVRAGDGAGVGRVIGGVFAGQDAPVVFEKANQPVLDTDKAPDAGHRGERELGVSVDRIDRDGGAQYLAGKTARVYRQLTADGASLESLSVEQRRSMRDQLIQGVYDGDGQHPSGEAGSESQTNTLTYIRQVAAVLFGLADELPGTPEFLRQPKAPTSDDERVGRIGADYLRLKAEPTGTLIKSAGTGVTVYCRILHKNDALREVHGIIAEEQVDKSGEILDYASSEPYFRKWSSEAAERTASAGLPVSFGNVREQHSPRAVGKLTSIQFDALNKRIPVVAKIVDDDTWRKVQAGVLTGFSIGGSYLNKWSDGNYTRYTAKPAEVSIVDNPCMPGAAFSMVKDTPGNPDLDALRKQLLTLTENIRAILARRAGHMIESTRESSGRFVTKEATSGNDPRQLIHKALENGVSVQFSGQDPRDAAAKSGKFQTRR